MKKLIVLITALFFLTLPCAAMAKTYTLTTGTTADSGNTTAPNGTSPFYVDGSNYDLYPQLNREYVYGFQLTGLQPSDSQLGAGGDWSGVTLSVFMKFKSESDDVPWEAVEPVYLFKNVAANSGTTPEVRWIKAPPADRARVYLVSEGGNTVFGTSTGKLIGSEVPLDVPESVVLIPAVPAYYLTNTSSGVSTITVPAGASKTYVRVTGSDIRYTLDGTTPDANSSPTLAQDQVLEISGKGNAQAFKFRETIGGSGSTVYPVHTNEKK